MLFDCAKTDINGRNCPISRFLSKLYRHTKGDEHFFVCRSSGSNTEQVAEILARVADTHTNPDKFFSGWNDGYRWLTIKYTSTTRVGIEFIQQTYHQDNGVRYYKFNTSCFLCPVNQETTVWDSRNTSMPKHLRNCHDSYATLLKRLDQKKEQLLNYQSYAYHNSYSRQSMEETKERTSNLAEIPENVLTVLNSICVMWVSRNARPLKIVEDGYLRQLLEMVYFLGLEHYEMYVPTANMVKDRLEDMVNHCQNQLRNVFSLKKIHFAVTLDYWFSVVLDAYLGVTVHYIDPVSGVFVERTLAILPVMESQTADKVKENVLKIIGDLGLVMNRCIAIVSDSGSNIVAAFNDFNETEELNFEFNSQDDNNKPIFGRISCLDHKINTVVQYITGKTTSTSNQKIDFGKFLKQINENKWNSIFDRPEIVKLDFKDRCEEFSKFEVRRAFKQVAGTEDKEKKQFNI